MSIPNAENISVELDRRSIPDRVLQRLLGAGAKKSKPPTDLRYVSMFGARSSWGVASPEVRAAVLGARYNRNRSLGHQAVSVLEGSLDGVERVGTKSVETISRPAENSVGTVKPDKPYDPTSLIAGTTTLL